MNKNTFSNKDVWKGIILFGLNAATYKMALANSLLDFSAKEATEISWEDLSQSFLYQYQKRLDTTNMPQQNNSNRLTVMERVVKSLKLGSITQTEAIEKVSTDGLKNVVPRFQTIGRDKKIAHEYFYKIDYGKKIILKDSLLAFNNEDHKELHDELMARWSLLEGVFSITINNFKLANDIREVYLLNGYRRTNLTKNIPFLTGYQGNTCFYCGEVLTKDIHVDHVLPRQVMNNDEIWNLVLAHGECNLQKSDKLVGPHFIQKLIARNENIMGSNHPWKNKISNALGVTPQKRAASLRKHYDDVKKVLGSYWWGGSSSYNPSTDPIL